MNILITGGIGFIGTNCAIHFGNNSNRLTLVDNFSRPGVAANADFLQKNVRKLELIQRDVHETKAYLAQIKSADLIIHLAGQTAVTTSITNPLLDFRSNIEGGFMLLEAVRQHNPHATLLYSSTNKVYGNLEHHHYRKDTRRQRYLNLDYPSGISETELISFISPYGCSKGSIDFYVQDYARIYGLKTVVFRQSCIYGPFQIGVEDQGWVAYFSKQALTSGPLTIFGDGYQVRDLLFVQDLISAYALAHQQIDKVTGSVFNIGGGPANSYSLLEVISLLEKATGQSISYTLAQERQGDQKYFVSDNRKVKAALGWAVKTDFKTGVKELINWQRKNLMINYQ